ncbi:nitrilase-related carbon-nitrogen hydrolase [Pseudofrancisella aestuarii]|uniref:Nitrilase-related carbon-nitrogen hydrolase n=1 Tax=Pseudofrancisella aestuarii TaxID=2670347 RepID=A0ABV9TA27_9GAMM|nr:nitrilase-related carbon-nitrogen hydrolase [Pseudofrancisella aestuarii]
MSKITKILFIAVAIFFANSVFAEKVKVAAIQLTAKQQSLDELESTITKYATDAKAQGANIIVFPEDDMLNLVYDKHWKKDSLLELAKQYDDLKTFISSLSRKLDVYIIGGTTAQVKADGKLYNTALIGIPSGYVIEHDKIYLTPGEVKVGYDGSGNDILVINTKYGRIAILICYTSEFANISYALGQVEPDLIIVPSYTDNIYGLNRVHAAIRMLTIQNYAYGLVVGMVSNRDKNNLEGADGVAQMLFLTPQQKDFPVGEMAKGKFNQEQMLIETFDIDKLHSTREEFEAYPNKDALDTQKTISVKTIGFK